MSTNYPTSLDTLTNPTALDKENVVSHSSQHTNINDAMEAVQAKVGINSSAVTTSHDYKLSEVTSTDKAVSKTATQTLTNKTLTAPIITGATATTTTVNGVTLSIGAGTTTFLRGDGTYTTPTAGDASYSVKGSVQGLTDAATSGLTISSGVISVNSGTGANNILKLNASSQIPAVDGSLLTNLAAYKLNRFVTYTLPADTVENTVFTTTITGGLLSTTGQIRIDAPLIFRANATATDYTLRLKFGGSTLSTLVITSPAIGGGTAMDLRGSLSALIANNASVSSQVVSFIFNGGWSGAPAGNPFGPYVSTEPADTTSSINTASNQTLTITVQKSAAVGGANQKFFAINVDTIKN